MRRGFRVFPFCAFLITSGCERCHDDMQESRDDSPSDDSHHSDEDDHDGDGYGADDCNDNDSTIHPGAPELCDDLDNDCDLLIDEDIPNGVFFADSGSQVVLGETGPEQITEIQGPGRIEVCGTLYARIVVDGFVAIGPNTDWITSGASSATVISAQEMGTALRVLEGGSVDVFGLTLTGGAIGDCAIANGSLLGGGGVCCEPGSTLSLESTSIVGNSGNYGGGILADNCTLVIKDSQISENHASASGGGLLIFSGSAMISNTIINYNYSDAFGGAVTIGSTTSVTVSDSEISQNHARAGGALNFEAGSGLTCADNSSVFGNYTMSYEDGGVGGAVWFTAPGDGITSNGCNWGIGESNNFVGDRANDFDSDVLFAMDNPDDLYDFGDDEYFTCNYDLCPVP